MYVIFLLLVSIALSEQNISHTPTHNIYIYIYILSYRFLFLYSSFCVLCVLPIFTVRGLLLYGKPGCGKTLLARTLGGILSPMRPITVVSGPEIMDKFVGSSEKVRRKDEPKQKHKIRWDGY